MALKPWKELKRSTRNSPKKLYEYIRSEVNGVEESFDISVNTTDGTSALGGVAIQLVGATTLKGTTGSKGGCNINNVPAGTYTVKATKTGYTYADSSLTVTENQTLEIALTAVQSG